jgi:hypothetical protein
VLEQDRHQVGDHDDSQKRIAELGATSQIRSPIARVHITDGNEKARPRKCQQLSPKRSCHRDDYAAVHLRERNLTARSSPDPYRFRSEIIPGSIHDLGKTNLFSCLYDFVNNQLFIGLTTYRTPVLFSQHARAKNRARLFETSVMKTRRLTRRKFFRAGVLGAAGAVGLAKFSPRVEACMECLTDKLDGTFPIGKTSIVGSQVIPVAYETTASSDPHPPASNQSVAMDPMKFLTTFDYGKETKLSDGRTRREYFIWAEDKELEVAEGIKFITDSCRGRRFGRLWATGS